MSTDKTLADVQPGGRVRLGDQAERARFEEWVSGKGIGTDRWKNGAYMSRYVQEKWEIWQAALSAQPSPGGQGDALAAINRVVEQLEDMERGCRIHPDYLDDARVAQAALAARQPVGQPVAWMHTHKTTGRVKFGLSPMYDCDFNAVQWDSVALYAAPAQAVDLGAVRALLRRRIEQWRSHLPADPGAPGTREIETKGEHDYNNDVRIYREGIAVMEEVLYKIDSQAGK